MSKLVSGYLWAFRNYESGKKSVNSLRKFYTNADIFINVDFEGDVENYKKVCEEIGATLSVNQFQLGYCGNFGDRDFGYECWSRESTFEWLRGIYEACKKTDSKYMFLLEEDDFILNEVSLLKEDVSMAIHPTSPSPTGWNRPNFIPNEFLLYINDKGGIADSPGYASGGGTFFNRLEFIDSWERVKNDLWKDYDYLKSVNKIIGWADYILQFVMQVGGYQIVQNNQLCEHWELPNDWEKFEIVTGLKDHTLIKL